MEREQNESPGVSFDPIHTDGLALDACRYLGLDKDPNTSVAFPHEANYCHKLGSPAGIDLAHQSGYCLSGSHANCHVYKQPVREVPPLESPPQSFKLVLPSVALPSLDDLPSLGPRLDSLKLRFLSLRLSLLLFRLRLRARRPDSLSLKQVLPAVNESWSKLSKNAPSFDQTLASLRNRIPADKVNSRSLRQLDLSLFAIPAMLLLILLAAIIWWPPLGETEQDAIAVGASISEEMADLSEGHLEPSAPAIQEDLQPASSGSSRDKPVVPDLKQVSGATTDRSGQAAVEAQKESTDSFEAAEVAVEESLSSAGTGAEALLQPVETAVTDNETAPMAEQTEAEIVQSSDQVGEAETAAVTQVEAPAPAEASDETAEPDILPVAAIASIGPATGIQNPQEIYETREPLFLYASPSADADVLAQITKEQPAMILGRDSSGEWILVRLNGNIEGWANAALSGVGIPVSNLPAVGGDLEAPLPGLLTAITGVVNIGALNVRAGPGIDFESIGVVYNKDEVSLLGQPESNGWVQVRLANGLSGWLNSSYLVLPG